VNNDKVLCGSFGLYTGYVAGILISAKEISFYVLCSEEINYSDYIEKYISWNMYIFMFLTKYNFEFVTEHHFQLTFGGETVTISFEARLFHILPSETIFAQSVLK
jgi:hypothetical protein